MTLLMCGCGEVEQPDDPVTRCSEMACDYIICESCPVCGHPETTCGCGTFGPVLADGTRIGTDVPCDPDDSIPTP